MGSAKEIPDDFMRRLPTPLDFYTRRFPRLAPPDENGWTSAVCPLGRYPIGHRVRIDVVTGRFACDTCGRGDFILFEMLRRMAQRGRTEPSFKGAVLAMIAEAEDAKENA